MKTQAQVQSWRAIEALRAGVPNRDAVKNLGSSQPAIEQLFREQLKQAEEGLAAGKAAPGLLIKAGFGSGKSHLLEYLQHVALENNFVVSKVVVSKETPLYDPGKVYDAAIAAAKVPDRTGDALTAIAMKLRYDSPQYAEFFKWVNDPRNGLSTRFAASVYIFEHGRGDRYLEVADRIIQFWSGQKLPVAEFRGALTELREAATYKLDKASVKDLASQRYRFAPRLMIAAGYAGWIVLVDEVELVSGYSLRQRARSYAEIARLMGSTEGDGVVGLTTVLTISDVFAAAVIEGRMDDERIPAKLRAGGTDAETLLATLAERGMRMIQEGSVKLENPNRDTIHSIYTKVKSLYETAYGGTATGDFEEPDYTRVMRQHVKRWIHMWDLNRLYHDYRPTIEVTDLQQDYSERHELEAPPADEADDGAERVQGGGTYNAGAVS